MKGCGPEWHRLQFHWTMFVSDLIILNECSQLAGAAIVSVWGGGLGYSRASDRADAARAAQVNDGQVLDAC